MHFTDICIILFAWMFGPIKLAQPRNYLLKCVYCVRHVYMCTVSGMYVWVLCQACICVYCVSHVYVCTVSAMYMCVLCQACKCAYCVRHVCVCIVSGMYVCVLRQACMGVYCVRHVCVCTVSGMYMCVLCQVCICLLRVYNLPFFDYCPIRFWNSSNEVVFICFSIRFAE